MKFLALSVILALAVSLSGALSVDQGLHQEWELFKVNQCEPNASFCYERDFFFHRTLTAKSTLSQRMPSA